MFKRKRLFERSDSYYGSGIPCGNPKRIQTGEVLCMPSKANTKAVATLQGESEMETQGEKQLRVMAKKQLKTDFTMKELLTQQRQFSEAGRYKPLTNEIRGMLELQEYQDVARGDQRVEILRQYGLTDEEIRLQLGKEGLEKGLETSIMHKSTFGTNPDIQRDQLHAIEAKIKEKEDSLAAAPDLFRGQKEVSRQEMDLEKAMFRGTDRDKNTLSNLLTERRITGDPNDPVNHLPQLLTEIEERAREKIKDNRRRRRRNRKPNSSADCVEDDPGGSENSEGGIVGCLTREEMIALKQSDKSIEGAEEATNSSCTSSDPSTPAVASSHSTVCAGGNIDCSTNLRETISADDNACNKTNEGIKKSVFIPETARNILKDHVEFLPRAFIEENRLSIEEIRNLPKFTHYNPGNLSNVLFVKNLSPRACERDLVSLFGQFKSEVPGSEIIYKQMVGRMRGQAFITFCNSDVATQALKLVNGFMLHGQPVIVQYGRRNAT